MATYVLIPGAGSDSWFWHLVVPELIARGHDVVAPDLPIADDSAGLREYTDVVLDAIGERRDLVVVGQSMGGFTAALVCDRVPVDLLILLAAMVPLPGETPGDWWANTGWQEQRAEQAEREGRPADEMDPMIDFFNDLPSEIVAELMARGEPVQSGTPFEKPWPLTAWPSVATRFLLCRDDHFFPAEFMRRMVPERLGITPDEIDGGHLTPLSRPHELVERFETMRIETVSR